MKKRNLLVMSGVAAACAFGFGLNVNANTAEVTITPCSYGHENCNGVHTNGECPNGNEPGSAMGYHHEEGHGYGNGIHDGSGHHTVIKE